MNEYRILMETLDHINEGDDESSEDLQNNHPEVHDFLVSVLGPYAVRDASVDAFDLGSNHYIAVKVKPSAGLGNTVAVLQDMPEVHFEQPTDRTLKGEVNGINFEIEQELTFGNNTQKWTFTLPQAVEEDRDGDPKWDYVCPSGHHSPYEGTGAPEYIVRPCPQCGLKAKATKQQVEEDRVDELKYDREISKQSMKAGKKDAKKGRDWNSKKTKFKDNESDPHAYMAGQNKGKKKVKEVQEEPTLTRGEKALGWRIKNGIKVKIGKGKPTVAPSFGDTMNNFTDTPRTRTRNRNSDDGSRGLSDRDRNR